MENRMVPNNNPREISVVTAEIKELCRQAQNMMLAYVVEIGRRLVEAKGCLHHGEWGDWLANEVNFSQTTANNYMKIFEEYGSQQISFFGGIANSQTFANLPYSKALKLIALPAEEREEFVSENDTEHMSVRELEAAIRERNEAREAAEEAKRREQEMTERAEAAEAAAEEAKEAVAEAESLRQTVTKLQGDVEAANAKAKKASEKLKAALSDPKVSPEQLKKIQEEAEAAANKMAEERLKTTQQKLDEAEERIRQAESRKKEAEARLEEAEKVIKTASPEITAFKTLFEEIQKTGQALKQKIAAIEREDSETARKLKEALSAFGKTL